MLTPPLSLLRMPANETRTVYVHGREVEFTKREDRPGDGAVLDAEADDRKWRIEVTSQGEVDEVVTAWDSDGNVVAGEEPDWLSDALRQLAGAPA